MSGALTLLMLRAILAHVEVGRVPVRIEFRPKVGETYHYAVECGFWLGTSSWVFFETKSQQSIVFERKSSNGYTGRIAAYGFRWSPEFDSDDYRFEDVIAVGARGEVHGKKELREAPLMSLPELPLKPGFIYPKELVRKGTSWSFHKKETDRGRYVAEWFVTYTYTGIDPFKSFCHRIESKALCNWAGTAVFRQRTYWVDVTTGIIERIEEGSRERCGPFNANSPPKNGDLSYGVVQRVH